MRLLFPAAILAMLLAPCSGWAGDTEDAAREYAVKAAFLYKFTQYVGWPEGTFKSDDAPIVLGVLGDSPFGAALDDIAKASAGSRAHGRTLTVKYFRTIKEYEPCHVLFICSSETTNIAPILDKTRSAPVLVVGDAPGLAEKGASMNFLIDDGKVRFDVNLDAAKQAHLKISANLIRVAHNRPD